MTSKLSRSPASWRIVRPSGVKFAHSTDYRGHVL
jgi:hypothetical protein